MCTEPQTVNTVSTYQISSVQLANPTFTQGNKYLRSLTIPVTKTCKTIIDINKITGMSIYVTAATRNKKSNSSSVVKMLLSAPGLRFESQVGQIEIGHSVDNGSPLLQCFFRAVLPRRETAEMGPTIRSTLRCTARITKI